jgi:hypothetical protein
MSNVVVTLGDVSFQDFEVPEKISFGGTQRLAVQELIGGGRVVDALGYDDGEISFSGIFSGDDAAQRAQTLDTERAAGAVLALFWDQYFYNVVIAEFAADYEKPWWIPFALRCIVASDPAVDNAVTPAVYLVSNDLSVVTSLLGQAGLVLGGLTDPTVAGLATAGQQCGRGGGRGGRGVWHRRGESDDGEFGRFGGGIRDERLSQPRREQFGRGIVMSIQIITVAGGNLFTLAAKYLNDATQWIRIAQANNLSDPVLNGVVTLTIPAVNAAAGGGIAR